MQIFDFFHPAFALTSLSLSVEVFRGACGQSDALVLRFIEPPFASRSCGYT
jgi:hypothetical protein